MGCFWILRSGPWCSSTRITSKSNWANMANALCICVNCRQIQKNYPRSYGCVPSQVRSLRCDRRPQGGGFRLPSRGLCARHTTRPPPLCPRCQTQAMLSEQILRKWVKWWRQRRECGKWVWVGPRAVTPSQAVPCSWESEDTSMRPAKHRWRWWTERPARTGRLSCLWNPRMRSRRRSKRKNAVLKRWHPHWMHCKPPRLRPRIREARLSRGHQHARARSWSDLRSWSDRQLPMWKRAMECLQMRKHWRTAEAAQRLCQVSF